MNLTEQERQIIVGCIDTLATSLTAHGHQWTEGERAIYETACEFLGISSPCTDHLCEGCGKPATKTDSEGVHLCDDCYEGLEDDSP